MILIGCQGETKMLRRLNAIGVMSRFAAFAALIAIAVGPTAAATPCERPGTLGVARIVDIDARNGPHFGDISNEVREPTFLAPKEVVLTFDDGPMPGLTRQILDTLDRFCTKATFFQVGRMAVAYPGIVKEVIARGHTVGTHTWSHPLHLRRAAAATAETEIEKGFAAVTLAAGEPVSPFFRFPGLADSPEMLNFLQSRGVATFTVDVVSDDSFIQSTERLIQTTLKRVEARDGGILLFHDIKAQTARALPAILTALQSRGYRVVHLTSTTRFMPTQTAIDEVTPLFERINRGRAAAVAQAFALPIGPVPVTRLAPEPRTYGLARLAAVIERRQDRHAKPSVASPRTSLASGWSTEVRRVRRVSDAE
jgi:peptidoglycan/xylan/chitin deacetylase (PgdA/CDA1 family)